MRKLAASNQRIARSSVRALVGVVLLSMLSGCGLMAAPCRVASAGLKIIPVVGHAAAVPTDACATAIDP
ncbi:hypothetical protein ABW99_08870 [Pandoraea thiooxydans]|uniref:Lipoprotein n=1 Tax=Pandoraea thiooxydans TaxID=445709 RepID=A0A0G3EMU4_9BURK|nr:hypothetical protein ABW99_08870 [Pandoraea thiooxydans]